MKLRQKLAAVLAATMVITAVPVVTFAASENRVTGAVKVSEGTVLKTNTAPKLVIDLEDGMNVATDSFYITLENASFAQTNPGAYDIDSETYGSFRFRAVSDTELEVTTTTQVAVGTNVAGGQVRIPMLVEVEGGEAKAIVNGNNVVSQSEIVFAVTNEGSATVSVDKKIPSFYTEGGEIAAVTVTEDIIGALEATKDKNGMVEITIALDGRDFEIDTTKTTSGSVEVTLGRGFRGNRTSAIVTTVDKDEVTIKLPVAAVTGTDRGSVTVEGIIVKADVKAPEAQDLTVEVINKAVKKESHKVATVAQYGVKLENTAKDNKAVEMVSGNKEEIEFVLSETVSSTIAKGRTAEFVLSEGKFVGDITYTFKSGTSTKEKDVTVAADKLIYNSDKSAVIGFEYDMNDAQDGQFDTLTVTANVVVGMNKDTDVTIKASGRAIGEEVELVVAKATPAVKVESTQFELNAGIKEQKGGKIVITETDKGKLQKGKAIEITLPGDITFTDKPKVEVTAGDLLLDTDNIKLIDTYKVKVTTADAAELNRLGYTTYDATTAGTDKYAVVTVDSRNIAKAEKAVDVITKEATGTKVSIPVSRSSREASTITITELPVKLDRSVPTGAYNATVKGAAIGTEGGFEQKGFFQVGIKDETAGEKVTTTIAKDATVMVVNGKDVELPAPAYIKGNKLMAPLRVVANAFGFENEAINYNSATKEILVRGNGSVVKLTIGKKEAFVDGTPMTLAVPAEITAESTYVPVGDLARLLGITVEWDAATKTATFKN